MTKTMKAKPKYDFKTLDTVIYERVCKSKKYFKAYVKECERLAVLDDRSKRK